MSFKRKRKILLNDVQFGSKKQADLFLFEKSAPILQFFFASSADLNKAQNSLNVTEIFTFFEHIYLRMGQKRLVHSSNPIHFVISKMVMRPVSVGVINAISNEHMRC